MQDRTALYRYFAGDGSLLYVGISVSAMARLCQHVGGSSWAGDIARVSIEWFDTRRAALAAERNAIRTERPAHNVQHNWRGRGLSEQPVNTVTEFIEGVGRDRFMAETGLKAQVISRAVVENIMPPGWYLAVRSICRSEGVEIPEHLFRWMDKRKSPEAAPASEASDAR